jgi:DNA segregation ATPase FtsK/SpoIIIE, S-DNA-T family
MKVKLTLVRPGSSVVDLTLTAEPTTTVGDIARELANADPARTGETFPAGSVTLRLHSNGGAGTATTRVVDRLSTLADSQIGSGAVVSLAASSEQSAAGRSSAATLRVVSGLETGKSFDLVSGSNVVGRADGLRVTLIDPLVSKSHVRINVTDHAEIIDLGSANGTMVNGEQVDRAILADGDVVTIGDTAFVVGVAAQAAAVESGGSEQFNRSPRLDPQYPGRTFESPETPERNKPPRLPIIALIAPLVMGVVLYIVTKSLTSLLFIGLSPLLLIATYVDNRVQIKRQWKTASADFLSTVTALQTEVEAEHDRERAGRLAEAPSLAEIVSSSAQRGTLLWTRRPEYAPFLQLRLGLGAMPSRCKFELPSQRKGIPEHWAKLVELRSLVSTVAGVPVASNFRESGNFGVAGPIEQARSVARGLVAQFAGLHSPAEVVVVAVASTSSSAGWDWLKWLPHVDSIHSPLSARPLATGGQGITALVSELEEVVANRASENTSDAAPLPAVLVVVEDDAPIDRARLVTLAERGPAAGVHLLWVASSLSRIPAAARTFVEIPVSPSGAQVGFVHSALGIQPVEYEMLDGTAALAFARGLSPVIDAGARIDDASDLPRSVSLLSLLGADLASEPDSVLGRWGETSSILTGPLATKSAGKTKPNLRAVFGQGSTEPFAVDLRADGPHALVGGTTGSGKSEFLQAWVLALAAAHSPQRVSFLFVDYKGGSAFSSCTELPHSVGIVTDLSQHMVRRALTSLRAELRYREHLFLTHGYKDIIDFEQSADPDVPPSLLIVVDEFAALATEVPEFVDGVVDVAQRGRSLGLHLILATQRPAGVIKDNLRANTNLRIALRMADVDDSNDVLDTPIAAGFDPAIPGRGAVRTGPGRIRSFQSGYAGGWTSNVPAAVAVSVEELSFGLSQQWEAPKDEVAESAAAAASSGPKDISRIVSNVKRAAVTAGIPAPRKPWLPVLAESYDFSKLPNRRTDTELVLGVVDDAAAQAQPTIAYSPDRDGNMAIVGTGGSGKSTVLRTIAVAAGIAMRGGVTHVYGLDFGAGGLQMLEALPHVGAVISGDDEERVARLLRWLRDLVDQRATRYSEIRAGSITEYRRLAKAESEPRILLLLDGMTAFRDAYENSVISPWFAVFSQIATDGRQVGVHIVVTGDRAGAIPASLSSSIQRRVVLRLAKQDDYDGFGIDNDVLSAASPPGRGVLDGLETQIAVLGGDANVALQARAIEELGDAMTKAGAIAAAPVERLTEAVLLRNLPDESADSIAVGLADDSLAPIGTPRIGSFVIAGPPGSGRTTTLLTLATSLHRSNPKVELYHLSARRSPMTALTLWKKSADGTDNARDLVKELTARIAAGNLAPGELAIFVEHLTDYHESELERDVEALIKAAVRAEQFIAGESESSTWNQAYSVGRPMRAARRGIILQPDDADSDLLKASFARIRGDVPPGRGFLVGGGRSRKLQVATTDDSEIAGAQDG